MTDGKIAKYWNGHTLCSELIFWTQILSILNGKLWNELLSYELPYYL